ASRVPVVWQRRAGGIRRQSELLHPVHGDYRWPRQPDWFVPWRGRCFLSSLGAALIFILPIVLRYIPPHLGIPIRPATVDHIQYMIIGALIVLFLIVEPNGLARLWQIGKQKLR